MNLSSLELRHLHYFTILAKELDFRRAARRLHISPSALGAQMRKLEVAALGFRLCERDAAPVRLTPAGKAFLPKARKLLDEVVKDTAEAAPDDLPPRRVVALWRNPVAPAPPFVELLCEVGV